MFWGHGDLWIANTHVAHWQIFNTDLSRTFRELNYEPELMLNFGLNTNVLGFKWRIVSISFNHQSNGQDLPRSRTCNRVIFHAGLERDRWMVVLRPLIRLLDEEDENPLIMDFIGRAEATVAYTVKNHSIYVIARNNLSFNPKRDSAQFNYVTNQEQP